MGRRWRAVRASPDGPDDKLLLPAPLPMGYHRLLVEQPGGEP